MSSFVSICLLPFVLFVIFRTFGDIFLTFHIFWWQQLTTWEESPHFCPKSIFQSRCKACSQSENVFFKTILHGSLGNSRVTWQSQNQNGVYMLHECGSLYNGCITAWNFHFSTRNSLKCMILESSQRNKEKGSPIKLHIEFYF